MWLLERLAKWRRRRQLMSEFTAIQRPDGSRMIVDQATLEYMRSTAPSPTQASLDTVLGQVVGVRVFANGAHKDSLIGEDVLLAEVDDRDSVTALGRALRIVDGPSGHCMCYGGPTLELLAPNNRRLTLLTVHHGQSIRWAAWKDDASLVDPSTLAAWLADRGSPSSEADVPKGTA